MRDLRTPRRRLMILLGGVLLWSFVIVLRIVDVQVYRSDDLRQMAKRQQFSLVEVNPVRGAILDRNGVELALSKEVHSVYAVPGLVTEKEAVAKRLGRLLGVRSRTLLRRLKMTDRNFVWIKRRVTDEQADAVEAMQIEGLGFREEPKRFYPRGQLAAHVLGYTGLENSGLAGIEQTFDSEIRGIPGVEITLRDARGVSFLPEPGGLPAEPGRNLILTLDASIQYIAERELARAVKENRAKAGVAVVLDPWTGEILAMAGEPTFDPNHYSRSSAAVRRNPVTQEAYEPGSTFKVITLAAAIDGNFVSLDESIDCGRGSIRIHGRKIRDHAVFDFLSPQDVLAYSSNVGTIKIVGRIPKETLYRHIRRFGFGSGTGISLPGESPGILSAPHNWSGLTRPSVSIGQEIGVTPLQLTRAIAAVANGGVLVEPHIVKRIEETDGKVVRRIDPKAVRRVISEKTARTLARMMQEVVRVGTGKAAQLGEISVAGKTGTAQKIVNGTYAKGRYVASFVAFAPADEPRLVILVTLDEPSAAGYYGGVVAAPVVKRIMEPALARLGVAAVGRMVEVPLIDFYPDVERTEPAAVAVALR